MNFIDIHYFWFLIFLIPLLIYKDIRDFRLTTYGYIFTYIFIVIALSRPVIKSQPIQNDEILNDVIIAIDLSYSMQAQDIEPSRLEFAKKSFSKLVDLGLKTRFGVIGFTTNAIILSPLTQDSELLKYLSNALDTKLIMTKGSAIMPVLKLARKISSSKDLTVVILSDGADKESYKEEAQYAKENSLVVNVFMIATTFGSTLVLENGELLKDEVGDIVITKSNENIALIPHTTGGVYTKDFDELLDALDTQRNKDYKTKTTTIDNIEFFYLFILLAIVTFLVTVTNLKNYLLAYLLIGINLDASILDYFKDENRVVFKKANSYYKAGEYEKALLHYQSLQSNSLEFKSKIYYNVANTLVRLQRFQQARENYLKSLTLHYSIEADENMRYIKNVKEPKQMSSRQKKSAKNSSTAKKKNSKKGKKDGGSSNMKVSADAGSGESKSAKESRSDAMLNLSQAKAKLSFRQYELINARSVNETKPY